MVFLFCLYVVFKNIRKKCHEDKKQICPDRVFAMTTHFIGIARIEVPNSFLFVGNTTKWQL